MNSQTGILAWFNALGKVVHTLSEVVVIVGCTRSWPPKGVKLAQAGARDSSNPRHPASSTAFKSVLTRPLRSPAGSKADAAAAVGDTSVERRRRVHRPPAVNTS